jgi:hypothetical protein
MALASGVSDDVQSPHTGPTVLWHVFTPAVQNQGKPRFRAIANLLHYFLAPEYLNDNK